MKIIFKPTFEIENVDSWYDGENLSKAQTKEKLIEDFSDFSVFMVHADYKNLKDIEVEVKD